MPEVIRKQIRNNDITSVIHAEVIPQVSLQPMLKTAEEVGKSLCNKKWIMYFSKGRFFATSDTPVIFYKWGNSSEYVGPAHPRTIVFCPLNKHMLLGILPRVPSDDKIPELEEIEGREIDVLNGGCPFCS